MIFLFLFTTSCAQPSPEKEYPRVVGDIEYDPAQDDAGFKICHMPEIYQYYNFGKGLQFKGEKIKIEQYFKEKYKGAVYKSENGYITIRFVVNCEGNTGRFRMQQMDSDFQPKEFPKGLTTELMTLTKNLEGWIVATHEDHAFDYYQYLTFKIENGNIKEILP